MPFNLSVNIFGEVPNGITWGIIIVLVLVAFVAGWIDTIAGGGGLIVMPALLLAGLPPALALATNKFQGTAGTFISSTYFLRKKIINFRKFRLAIITTFLGSVTGVWLILQLKTDKLVHILPFLLIGVGLYYLFSSKINNLDTHGHLSIFWYSLLISPMLGFYDGFFGPGTGSFFALTLITLRAYSTPKATAHAKLLNFTSNVSALLYFMFFGKIVWIVGICMVFGQIAGALLGASMVLKKGAALIRPLVVIVSFAMAIRIILANLHIL